MNKNNYIEQFEAGLQSKKRAIAFVSEMEMLLQLQPVARQILDTVESARIRFLQRMMTVAQAGLSADPQNQHIAIIPYRNSRDEQKSTVSIIIMYQGLLHIARANGVSIMARAVREKDTYENDPINRKIMYRKYLGRESAGDVVAYFAVATKEGTILNSEEMSYHEMVNFSKKYGMSSGRDTDPWRTDFDAMAKKTVIRQLIKYLGLELTTKVGRVLDDVEEYDTSTTTVAAETVPQEEPKPTHTPKPIADVYADDTDASAAFDSVQNPIPYADSLTNKSLIQTGIERYASEVDGGGVVHRDLDLDMDYVRSDKTGTVLFASGAHFTSMEWESVSGADMAEKKRALYAEKTQGGNV